MKKAPLLALCMTMLLLSGCKDALIRHFAFYPEKVSPDYKVNIEGLSEVFLTTSDGVRIHSLYLEHPDANQVVLFFHGNAGNAYHRVPDALTLRQTGVSVMLVSYRGYGKSEGTPNERGLYRDADAALKHLTDEHRFALKDIYLLGRSIGTTAATHLGRNRNVGGLILITPITSGKEVASVVGLGWLAWPMSPFFDNLEKIKHIVSPTLVIHGDADEIIPFSLGEKIYNAIPVKEKQFMRIKGAGHNNLVQIAGKQFWPEVGRFIQKTYQPD